MEHKELTKFGIPNDVAGLAKRLKVDAEEVLRFAVTHTVDAVHDYLLNLEKMLPKTEDK